MKPAPCLNGKRIVITGAGRGLGRALAIVAADHGAETVLLGRELSKLGAVAETIKNRTQSKPLAVRCDLADSDNVTEACGAVLADNQRVDVLINNGAPWLSGSLDELSDDDLSFAVAGGVTGTILVTKKLLPALRESAAADIVTIVSTSGVLGWDSNGGSVPFYAAKHGQSGFSDRLRHELKDTNIRVSAIYPPDFDDADPADSSWEDVPIAGANISNREVVATVLFILTAPRTCTFPFLLMDGTN